MKTMYFSLWLVLFVVLIGNYATPAHAYFTTHQSAQKVAQNTALFIIDYSLGREKDTVFMPILAGFNGIPATTSLTYTILDAENKPVSGTAFGTVLSKAHITTHGMYTTKPNELGKYRLAVFFTPDAPHATSTAYRLQVTSLPFNYNGTIPQHLNPSELKYYVTPEVQL